jgi:hypothetical protein
MDQNRYANNVIDAFCGTSETDRLCEIDSASVSAVTADSVDVPSKPIEAEKETSDEVR